MKICFLSSMHPALDKRVFYKEARGLSRAGHDVVHLAPGTGEDWVEDGVRLSTFGPSKGLLSRIMNMKSLYRRARMVRADVYHCNEIDSWMVGAAFRVFSGSKFVFDVHEHYPEDFAEHYFHPRLRVLVIG